MSNLTVADLKDRAVVSIGQAEKIGRVEDVILDLAEGRVAGFHVRTGLLGGGKILSARDIHEIGADAITVADRAALEGHSPDKPALDSLPTSAGLIGAKVVSDQGTGYVLSEPRRAYLIDYCRRWDEAQAELSRIADERRASLELDPSE